MEVDSSIPGRVVRLHFQCRAELPLGSSLRVTGSSLWAPTQLTEKDPTQGNSVTPQTASQTPFAAAGSEDWVDASVLDQSHTSMYTSSIEMYTTPETYPLWTTRRPVVIVLNKTRGIHHHYYRYLVVTPGAKEAEQMDQDDGDVSDSESEKGGIDSQVATTSNEHSLSSQVMLWEDPFENFVGSNLCNLPYRTIDIDAVENKELDAHVDVWNGKEDASFQPYLIREAVRYTLVFF